MKQIVKRTEPESFASWKNAQNQDWNPTFDILPNPQKTDLKTALLEEQGSLCCYCEKHISAQESHIEHFVPQALFRSDPDSGVDPLEYQNMHASCNGKDHCGQKKSNWYDADLLISPFDSGCESRFSYTFDGRILPSVSSDQGAVITIQKLGLDCSSLKALRNGVIEPFLDPGLTEEDLEIMANDYLRFLPGHGFNQFWTTIKCLFPV